jgi:hypothetical protein
MDYYGIALVEGRDAQSDKLYVSIAERKIPTSLNIMMSSNMSQIYVSSNGGKNWSTEAYSGSSSPFKRILVDPNNKDFMLGFGDRGNYKRVLKGSSYVWEKLPSSSRYDYYQVLPINDNGRTIWIANYGRFDDNRNFAYILNPEGTDEATIYTPIPVKIANLDGQSPFLRISFRPNDPSKMFILAGVTSNQTKLYRCDISYSSINLLPISYIFLLK